MDKDFKLPEEWTEVIRAAVCNATDLGRPVEVGVANAITPHVRELVEALGNPTEEMIDAALCGWNNVPLGHDFSPYQRSEETRLAWKRAISAAAQPLLSKFRSGGGSHG